MALKWGEGGLVGGEGFVLCDLRISVKMVRDLVRGEACLYLRLYREGGIIDPGLVDRANSAALGL
jgi:hypothetical protein